MLFKSAKRNQNYGIFDTLIVVPVVFLSGHVKSDEGDEASDLHEEVNKQRHSRVHCEGSDS
jgi:hypothetical protein